MIIYDKFQTDEIKRVFNNIYSLSANTAPQRYSLMHDNFVANYGEGEYRVFCAPGRCEIGGNHTDHNNGIVLACAVSCDTVCFARKRCDMQVHLTSFGYKKEMSIDLNDLSIHKSELGKTQSLVRGVAKGLQNHGYGICGFDAYVHSTVLSGSGLSSSAAFEVMLVTVISSLCSYKIDPTEGAIISQFAENNYFGKPSGLMDQMASSIGSLIAIDFKNPQKPNVKKIDYDILNNGYNLVITNTGGSHADLTADYCAIPNEMKQVANYFGKEVLREVDEDIFRDELINLKDKLPHRAILRALHFFGENRRVKDQIDAIIKKDMQGFLQMVKDSGESSYKLLQNIYSSKGEQGLALALNLAEKILHDNGAWRVHGGGFAGTMLAFVPDNKLKHYIETMDKVFGKNAAAVLSIRDCGAIEIII